MYKHQEKHLPMWREHNEKLHQKQKNTANLVLRNLSMKLFLSFHHSYLSNYQASPLQECILPFILVYSL